VPASRRGSFLAPLRRRAQSEAPRAVRRRAESDYVASANFHALSKASSSNEGGSRPRAGSRFRLGRTRTSSSSGRGLDHAATPRLGRRKGSTVHAVDLAVLNSMSISENEQGEDPEVLLPETKAGVNEEDEDIDVDEENCLICMGRFTGKKPAIMIPCNKKCNLAPVHAKCIFEWKEQKKGQGSCPLCRGDLGDVDYTPPDLLQLNNLVMFGARKQFCINPIPRGAGMVRCYVKVRNGWWGFPAHTQAISRGKGPE